MNLPKDTQMFGFPRGEATNNEIDNRNKLLATASWQAFPKPYKKGDIWLGRDAEGMVKSPAFFSN
jgi:hypothetical protein